MPKCLETLLWKCDKIWSQETITLCKHYTVTLADIQINFIIYEVKKLSVQLHVRNILLMISPNSAEIFCHYLSGLFKS